MIVDTAFDEFVNDVLVTIFTANVLCDRYMEVIVFTLFVVTVSLIAIGYLARSVWRRS